MPCDSIIPGSGKRYCGADVALSFSASHGRITPVAENRQLEGSC